MLTNTSSFTAKYFVLTFWRFFCMFITHDRVKKTFSVPKYNAYPFGRYIQMESL